MGVIGAIDGTYVKTKPRKERKNGFINRKGTKSIKFYGDIVCF